MKKTNKLIGLLTLGLLISFTACKEEEEPMETTTKSISLSFTGLEDLGDDAVYEGWIIVNGAPVSTGTFSSSTFPQTFQVDKTLLNMSVIISFKRCCISFSFQK